MPLPNDIETPNQIWDAYARKVISRDAHETQMVETRRAFYSGVLSTLLLLERIASDDVSEDDAEAIL
jgi:hypothetical protein